MDGICNIKSIRTSCIDIHLYCWLNCWVLFVDKIQIGRRSPSKGSFSHIFESDDVVSTNNFSAWNCREHKILTSWYYAVRRWINRRGNGTKFMLTYSLICRLNATPAVDEKLSNGSLRVSKPCVKTCFWIGSTRYCMKEVRFQSTCSWSLNLLRPLQQSQSHVQALRNEHPQTHRTKYLLLRSVFAWSGWAP